MENTDSVSAQVTCWTAGAMLVMSPFSVRLNCAANLRACMRMCDVRGNKIFAGGVDQSRSSGLLWPERSGAGTVQTFVDVDPTAEISQRFRW